MSTQSTPYPPEAHAERAADRVTIAALIAERDQLRTDLQSAMRLLVACEENRGSSGGAIMSTQWTDERIRHEIVDNGSRDFAKHIHRDDAIELMCRMRDDLTADLQSANRLLADCEENRGNLITAVSDLKQQYDALLSWASRAYSALPNNAVCDDAPEDVQPVTFDRNEMIDAIQKDIAESI